jgi:hypothetical protein
LGLHGTAWSLSWGAALILNDIAWAKDLCSMCPSHNAVVALLSMCGMFQIRPVKIDKHPEQHNNRYVLIQN